MKRAGGRVGLAALVVLLGAAVLANTAFATRPSVWTLGWIALMGGSVTVAVALTRAREESFRSSVVSGGLLTALGLMMQSHLEADITALTLMAGVITAGDGVNRLLTATRVPPMRSWFLASGLLSLALGAMALGHLVTLSTTLMAVLIGVQLILDGVSVVLAAAQTTLASSGAAPVLRHDHFVETVPA